MHLSFLRPLYDSPGPWATVYLDDSLETHPMRKIAPGGWSQARYQRSAELTWRRNTADVAVAVTELADLAGAEVVVVAGDVRARQLLIEQLPPRWRERVIQTEAGSRAPGPDDAPLDNVTVQAISETAAERTGSALDRFSEQRGNDAAVTGVSAVVAALDKHQVDTLLLDPEQLAQAQLWIGPDPASIATDADQLQKMGVDKPEPARADDALIRAAAATNANVILVGPDQTDVSEGVGAVLRYQD